MKRKIWNTQTSHFSTIHTNSHWPVTSQCQWPTVNTIENFVTDTNFFVLRLNRNFSTKTQSIFSVMTICVSKKKNSLLWMKLNLKTLNFSYQIHCFCTISYQNYFFFFYFIPRHQLLTAVTEKKPIPFIVSVAQLRSRVCPFNNVRTHCSVQPSVIGLESVY